MPHDTLRGFQMLSGSRWAIRPEMLPEIAARVPRAGTMAATAADPQTMTGVAVIPLTGVITPQGSWISMLFGGAPGGLAAFREALAEAIDSPAVSAILIDVDSPGGLIDLVPETAADLQAAKGVKPIVAIADTQMCSAAYWIASQADEIVASPSSSIGSIGVYQMHVDQSGANAMEGFQVSYISAGDYKVEGNPNAPLDPDAAAYIQQNVDDLYGMFVADVAQGRGIDAQAVLDNYGQGRSMNAQRALSAGLVDRIGTYEGVVGGLLGSGGSARRLGGRAKAEASEQQAILQAQLDAQNDMAAAAQATADAMKQYAELSAEDREQIAELLTS
jgi:capsid assembly protease